MEKLLEVTEIELHHLATFLKLVVEGIAIFIIALAIFKTVPKFHFCAATVKKVQKVFTMPSD